jgi:hypothetical protein
MWREGLRCDGCKHCRRLSRWAHSCALLVGVGVLVRVNAQVQRFLADVYQCVVAGTQVYSPGSAG